MSVTVIEKDFSTITVVVQGPVFGGDGASHQLGTTERCIAGIRSAFPGQRFSCQPGKDRVMKVLITMMLY